MVANGMSWQKQEPDKPLFPDLLWSRPENKKQAGKLLIIGGKAGEFMNVSAAYTFANEAGAGSVRTLLPDSLSPIAKNIEGVELAASNTSGGFAKNALASFFDNSDWADHVLIAGDLGKNSETTVILDGYLLRSQKPITFTWNALESIGLSLEQLCNLPITLVIDREILRKIGIQLKTHVPVTSIATFEQMKEIISDLSKKSKANFVTLDEENIWVACGGKVVSTRSKPVDVNALGAYCAVWQVQNPTKPLESLATAVYEAMN